MTEPVPPPRCAQHPEALASETCTRCGKFICTDCERRAEINASPMCPGCWALAARNAATHAKGGTALQTTGLVLGVLSVIPFTVCLFAPVSLVVNVIAIAKAKHPPARDVRWRPIAGLVLTALGFVLQVLFVAFYNFFSKR